MGNDVKRDNFYVEKLIAINVSSWIYLITLQEYWVPILDFY